MYNINGQRFCFKIATSLFRWTIKNSFNLIAFFYADVIVWYFYCCCCCFCCCSFVWNIGFEICQRHFCLRTMACYQRTICSRRAAHIVEKRENLLCDKMGILYAKLFVHPMLSSSFVVVVESMAMSMEREWGDGEVKKHAFYGLHKLILMSVLFEKERTRWRCCRQIFFIINGIIFELGTAVQCFGDISAYTLYIWNFYGVA